jgi:predicted nucleic acid-binding protein
VILADTSAWVEFDRATGSAVDTRLTDLIAGRDEVAVTEPVVAEVLASARTDEREHALRRLLTRFHLLPFDSVADFDGAVAIYRRCRQVGITPRGLLDCMIAAVALRHGVPVLAHDADLARIGQVMPLELDEASLRPQP